jgi:hypothetical protein
MSTLSRRAFLGAATAFTIVPRHVLGGTAFAAPSEKLNIAGIGVGGMGGGNLNNMKQENIVALCDVDHDYAAKTFAKFPDAKLYKDYREMLEQQKDIDAVLVATPDHTHAVISAAAMRAGKHVYCQKPLTHTVHEARRLAEIGREMKVSTQMGIQGHSSDDARKINEWVSAGAIGKVRTVHAWCDLSYYPWGHASWSSKLGVRPTETPPVPEKLDWNLWLGPAPERPYHPTYHPMTWRSWWDFGCGMMGDRGAHTIDPVYWALNLGAPDSIEASNTDLNPDTYPLASIVRYAFPARGDMPPVELLWYDGLRVPGIEGIENPRLLGDAEGGFIMIGEDGFITGGVYGNSPMLLPKEKFKDVKVPETIPRIKGSHEEEWIAACKEGRAADAGFDYSGPLTETALLGNIAKRIPGIRLRWNKDSMTFTDNDKATAMINPPYREGWTL